jgi:hypothetical protein
VREGSAGWEHRSKTRNIWLDYKMGIPNSSTQAH